jgi:hypothetical protein
MLDLFHMSKAYHVYSRQNGSWAVKLTQAVRARSVHPTQKAAIMAARKMAIAQKAELVVHAVDGKVQDRRTFTASSL